MREGIAAMPAIDQATLQDPADVISNASPISGGVVGGLPPAGNGLRSKVLRGGALVASGSVAEQVSRFLKNIILTRLLAPEAFGMMALVMSAGTMIQVVTDIGVKEGIIQHPKGADAHHMSAAWWLALLRSISIYACIFLLAPLIAKFYGHHELAPLLRVVALGVILEGSMSARAYIALKEMNFKKWAVLNHGGGILGVVFTVVLCVYMRNVWALVIGNVAESGMRCALSYLLCPYVPLLSWNKEAVSDLLNFSKGLFGLSFLNMIFSRTDVFVLAKLYPAADLGLYVMGIYLVQTPAGFLTKALGQTLLPAFSKVQGEAARENRMLNQITSVLIQAGLPAVVFIALCGRDLLNLVYGQRYGSVALSVLVASFVVFINVLNSQITVVFYGRGVPQLHRASVTMMAALMLVLIYPATKTLGLVGGQICCLLAVLAGFIFQLRRVHRLTGLSYAAYLRPFIGAVGLSALVLCTWLMSLTSAAFARPIFSVAFGIFGCLLAYAIFFSKARGALNLA